MTKPKKLRSKKKRRYPPPCPTKKREGNRVKAENVILKLGKGTPKSGRMPGGFFWHIFYKDEKAGKVYINYNKEKNRPEIQIFINQKSQGKGIGRIAYHKACELSQYEEIYATMRKNNIASLKAAFAAGFIIIPSNTNQVQMLWRKNIEFPIEAFEKLPNDLPRSAYIDFLLFLANIKPSLRLHILNKETKRDLTNWCKINDFYLSFGKENYVFIAKDQKTLKVLEQLDTSSLPHEYELGRLLGYPNCCCEKIANIGEENIDKYEKSLINNSKFKGTFELINPKGYIHGYALISHVPCSTNCKLSLQIALKSLYIISQYSDRKYFEIWKKYWKKYILKKY